MSYRDPAAIKTFLTEQTVAAGQQLMRFFGESYEVTTKKDHSIVTSADLAAEKALIAAIERFYPEDLIIAEESGMSDARRLPERFVWVIDPLDGTTNFANNYEFFCVSVGYGQITKEGTIERLGGAIYDPVRKELYLAYKGEGAFCNDRKISVRAPRPLEEGFLVTGFYYNRDDVLETEVKRFSRIAQRCQAIRRDGAAALDLALVARGVFDAFWERGLQPWDTCAGALLVTEAGGRVYDYLKEACFEIDGPAIVAGQEQAVRELISTWTG